MCKRFVTLVMSVFIELRAFGKRKFGDYVVWRGLAGHLHANSVPNDLIPPVLKHGPRSLPNVRALW